MEYGIDDPAQVDYQMVRSWLAALMEQKLSARSVNRKKTTLQTFFKFLVKESVITENPMNRILSPKTSKRLPVYVEEAQMERLFSPGEVDFGEGFRAVRDKMILETFYATGMRLSELVNLKETDIDTGQMTIRVLGKRNKERIIPFGKNFKGLIENYKAEREKLSENFDLCDSFL
jgi:integrase/recombinase XerC